MTQSNKIPLTRRDALKFGIAQAITLTPIVGPIVGPVVGSVVGSVLIPASSHAATNTVHPNNQGQHLEALINTLSAMDNAVCRRAAEELMEAAASASPLTLHVRNAGLDLPSILELSAALRGLSGRKSSPLRSISFSYNSELGDTGAIALSKTLPNTLHEVGFVDCGIHEAGLKALLQWAGNNPSLGMICIEGNSLSIKTNALFNNFRRANPNVSLFI